MLLLQICRNFWYYCVMSEPIDQLRSALKNAGFSLTHPREAVFMALQNQEPLTMKQLSEACSKIDRASVYRTVALFEKLGITHRIQIGWKYKIELSDTFHFHHHHLTCLNCGQVIPFEEDDELQKNLNAVAASHDFSIESHQLEIQGFCRLCATTTT